MTSYAAFGILCLQIYMYHVCFGPSDRRWLQVLVWMVFLISLVFQVCETYEGWWTLGSGWGRLDHLVFYTKSSTLHAFFNGVAASMVQGFYAWRIFVLGKSYWIPLIICLLLREVTSVATLDESNSIITAWGGLSVAADVLVTLTMVFYMLRQRKRSTFKETTTLVENAIKYIVETGAITTFSIVIELVVFLTLQSTNYHFILSSGQLVHTETQLRIRSHNALWSDQQNSFSEGGSVPAAVHVGSESVEFEDRPGLSWSGFVLVKVGTPAVTGYDSPDYHSYYTFTPLFRLLLSLTLSSPRQLFYTPNTTPHSHFTLSLLLTLNTLTGDIATFNISCLIINTNESGLRMFVHKTRQKCLLFG
ncbi:hypothetical protein BDP27DRAFT_1405409 [Rhodocollybia butyracea]|uniref:DUF6534 domain-containing protein n=1 Tax=Rhodocollybia butyracea TaxID=206335 RepID=A0A9P5U2S2_9AGAR|nr:hypothetical protein BDP27DRAFT_1405409 [Rhodocollybia butyracea]